MKRSSLSSSAALGSIAARLHEIYRECLEHSSRVSIVLETSTERISFSCRKPPAAAPSRSRRLGKKCPANEKRKERNRERREEWLERRNNRFQTSPASAAPSTAAAAPTAAADTTAVLAGAAEATAESTAATASSYAVVAAATLTVGCAGKFRIEAKLCETHAKLFSLRCETDCLVRLVSL